VKRRDALQAYHDYSARTSENVRRLSFAALAVVWLFKPEQGLMASRILVWAGVAAISALAADFLQSLYGTIAWGGIHRRKELAGLSPEDEFRNPRVINWPTNTLFALKVISVSASYVLVLLHLVRR
jgi:hypothetical protein